MHEFSVALRGMKNEASPGLDGLTAAWYKVFWIKIQDLIFNFSNM